MAIRSTLFRMAERAIGGDISEFLKIRRARGDSFDQIASDIRASHDFEVNSETLRKWATRLGVHEPARSDTKGP